MIYLFFLIPLLLISCNQDRVKDNSKNEIIEYFIPLSHRVEKDVNEVFEEYWYVPLETRDDALIEELYNIKNIVIYQEDIYIGSGSGRSAPLRALSPLRTVHDSFPSYGSSNSILL